MGALAGVKQVTYDCKSATITMQGDATLTSEAVTQALAARGFAVTSFNSGAPPTVAAHLFQITRMSPSARVEIEQLLRGKMPNAQEVVVDSTGFTIVTTSSRDQLVEANLAQWLAARQLGLDGFAEREWPKVTTQYEVDLTPKAGASPAEIRAILSKLEKVLAAQVFDGKAILRLKEPCDQIEHRVRDALRM